MYAKVNEVNIPCADYNADVDLLVLKLKEVSCSAVISAVGVQPESISIFTDSDDLVATYTGYSKPIGFNYNFATQEVVVSLRQVTDIEKEVALLREELTVLKDSMGGA